MCETAYKENTTYTPISFPVPSLSETRGLESWQGCRLSHKHLSPGEIRQHLAEWSSYSLVSGLANKSGSRLIWQASSNMTKKDMSFLTISLRAQRKIEKECHRFLWIKLSWTVFSRAGLGGIILHRYTGYKRRLSPVCLSSPLS